jgi:hypothetical protein
MGWSFTTHQAIFLGAINQQQVFFWRRCQGGSRRLLRGEFFAHTSFTLLFVLLYFIYFYLHRFIKNPKKIRIIGSCYFFTLVHYVVP